MAGALIHLGVGIILAAVVHLIHFKLEYSLSVFVGHLLPDAVKFGTSAIVQGTWNVIGVSKDSFYSGLSEITSSYGYWFTIGFFIFGLTVLLYHFHFIRKKKMEEYDELYIFLLIGIIVHLVLDVLIIEKSPWI